MPFLFLRLLLHIFSITCSTLPFLPLSSFDDDPESPIALLGFVCSCRDMGNDFISLLNEFAPQGSSQEGLNNI